MRHSYPEFRARNAELIEVGPDTPASARQAFRQYLGGRELEFPYLCDPGWTVHARYGLRQLSAGDALKSQAVSALALFTVRPFVTPRPAAVGKLMRCVIQQGLFIVDEGGIVRYAYVTAPNGQLPPAETLLAVLDGAEDAGDRHSR